MNVVMMSPGFPLEMAYFTRALAQTGATVIGVGDQPVHVLPPEARDHLAHYEHVSLADEGAVLAALRGLARHARDRPGGVPVGAVHGARRPDPRGRSACRG